MSLVAPRIKAGAWLAYPSPSPMRLPTATDRRSMDTEHG